MRALFTHAWLLLGKWLGCPLLPLPVVGLDGQAIGSLYYTWKFSGPASTEGQIAPDEVHIIQAIIQDIVRMVEQHRDNTRVPCNVRAKTHGCVEAEFKVRADLDSTLHRGAFAKTGKSWNTWVHFSNSNAYPQFDNENDACGMAIELLDVPGEELLPDRSHDGEQDFVIFNQPVFFTRDIVECRQNFTAQADGKKALTFFPNRNPTSWGLRHLLVALRILALVPDSPPYVGYNGISSYKLGEHNIKFRVIPTPGRCPVYQLPKQNQDLPNFLRVAPHRQLPIDHTPACYAFQVQCQNPGKRIPVEDTSIEWKESDAPFVTIADIIMPVQDFDSREQNLFCDSLSFNLRHALPEHQPIGGVNRLWKVVYKAVNGYRLGRNG